ncbi:hypothetical protein OL233_02840 [Vagococcus sp. PNs007]|uniref:Uncharacterized protein n=1 Tax=Vagococcus proximus TaxID=2991417 RepID=A0ABT5WZR1_9ENTE|nr:hypothetical protein [Vagococcus proximus]MDF0479214.1 hypothetical protein [Vagococcus proximus]
MLKLIRELEERRPDLFVFAPCGNIQPLQVIVDFKTAKGELTAVCWVPDTVIERVTLYQGETKLSSYLLDTESEQLAHYLLENGYLELEISRIKKTTRNFTYEL